MAPKITITAEEMSSLGPLAAHDLLLLHAREDSPPSRGDDVRIDPSAGVTDPHDISNLAMFVLFGVIGAACVVTAIWFFFWARDGGFVFRENDWDEYKSTVLRRRGPNGTILSNATPSTDLGGGSIYRDVIDHDAKTEYTSTTRTGRAGGGTDVTSTVSGITAGVSDIAGREKRRKKIERREREREAGRRRKDKERQKEKEKEKEKERSGREKDRGRRSGRHVGEDGVLIDEEAEREATDHLRSYKREKAARVGGINKESDATTWDGSTNPPTESNVSSEAALLQNRERTPTTTPTGTPTKKKSAASPSQTQTPTGGAIRKVYSTADRTRDREQERIRAEARRLQELGRAAGSGAAHRRDLSYGSQRDGREHRRDGERERERERDRDRRSHVPGSWTGSDVASSRSGAGGSDDTGTKSYHHPIPELSARRGGYRRGRGDEY